MFLHVYGVMRSVIISSTCVLESDGVEQCRQIDFGEHVCASQQPHRPHEIHSHAHTHAHPCHEAQRVNPYTPFKCWFVLRYIEASVFMNCVCQHTQMYEPNKSGSDEYAKSEMKPA